MHFDWLIIDGFSLLYRIGECAALQRAGKLMPARARLVRFVDRVAGRLAARTTIVFDGQGGGGPSEEFAGASVEVIFSPSHLTADSVIERMVRQAPDPSRISVVSSDRMERDNVSATGARTLSCSNFLEIVAGETAILARRPAAARRPPPANRLGEYFPPAES